MLFTFSIWRSTCALCSEFTESWTTNTQQIKNLYSCKTDHLNPVHRGHTRYSIGSCLYWGQSALLMCTKDRRITAKYAVAGTLHKKSIRAWRLFILTITIGYWKAHLYWCVNSLAIVRIHAQPNCKPHTHDKLNQAGGNGFSTTLKFAMLWHST